MENAAVSGKKLAAGKAIEYIKDGMTVGLGTGSTAYWAIQGIGEMVKKGLSIRAIATSVQSENLARELNIPIVPFSEIDYLDVTIDGADECGSAVEPDQRRWWGVAAGEDSGGCYQILYHHCG
ncbi:ribose-5-phosphate isomerase A [Puia sp. P3]|uniref:ribose-5-phosphate isomerase A n=1 Tax=Puia sp. P3 TaxID=3423952 RepID=UPI003D67406D